MWGLQYLDVGQQIAPRAGAHCPMQGEGWSVSPTMPSSQAQSPNFPYYTAGQWPPYTTHTQHNTTQTKKIL